MKHLFIVDLNYIAPLERIDTSMADHMQFLKKYYSLNLFLASGRKVPRTGGIILALAADKATLEKIMNEDPFCQQNLAKAKIIEFQASQAHPTMKILLDGLRA